MRKKTACIIVSLLVVETIILAGIGFYDLALFNEVRVSLITKAITGIEMLSPIVGAVIKAIANN